MKFLLDETRGEATRTYAIGLHAEQGVYKWLHVTDAGNNEMTPNFHNWAPAEPKGAECVTMEIGEAVGVSGLWEGSACTTPSTIYGICEKIYL